MRIPNLALRKLKNPLVFQPKRIFRRIRLNTMTMHGATSPKLVRRVKKPQNQKPILKPLIDPDFNYNTVRKKIDQKLIDQKTSELMASFTNNEEYHEIKVYELSKG